MESIEPRWGMSDTPPVRTALFEEHLALDANMVDSTIALDYWLGNFVVGYCSSNAGTDIFSVRILHDHKCWHVWFG